MLVNLKLVADKSLFMNKFRLKIYPHHQVMMMTRALYMGIDLCKSGDASLLLTWI